MAIYSIGILSLLIASANFQQFDLIVSYFPPLPEKLVSTSVIVMFFS